MLVAVILKWGMTQARGSHSIPQTQARGTQHPCPLRHVGLLGRQCTAWGMLPMDLLFSQDASWGQLRLLLLHKMLSSQLC